MWAEVEQGECNACGYKGIVPHSCSRADLLKKNHELVSLLQDSYEAVTGYCLLIDRLKERLDEAERILQPFRSHNDGAGAYFDKWEAPSVPARLENNQ